MYKRLSMREEDIFRKLFGFGSNTTYYNWKKDPKRIIIKLLDKYLSNENLEEFLETGEIKKFEKEININDIAPKLYYFKRRTLTYLYFLITNNNIKDIDDFNTFVQQDITNAQDNSRIEFIKKHFKSIKWEWKNDLISFNTFAQEFKDIYQDYISDDEISFMLKNELNRDSFKKMIHFILENKLNKI